VAWVDFPDCIIYSRLAWDSGVDALVAVAACAGQPQQPLDATSCCWQGNLVGMIIGLIHHSVTCFSLWAPGPESLVLGRTCYFLTALSSLESLPRNSRGADATQTLQTAVCLAAICGSNSFTCCKFLFLKIGVVVEMGCGS
jgi:hypothetical protein